MTVGGASPSPAIVARLAACGLDPQAVSIERLAEDDILIVIHGNVSPAAMRADCILDVASASTVLFDDPSAQIAYDRHVGAASSPPMVAQVERQLTMMGLLRGFPRRPEYPDLRRYAAALSRHAGVANPDMLDVTDAGTVSIAAKAATRLTAQHHERLVAVLLYASLLGDVPSMGVNGNAVARDPAG